MKNSIRQIASVILILLLTIQYSFANEPAYKLSAENVKYTSANTIEFDIYLQHTNPNESKFNYALGQYFFEFNPKISNGGTMTYTLVSSDLPQNLQPVNASVSGNLLRLATNSIPSFKENLFIVSDTEPGTLIARMRLETSAAEFSDVPPEIRCRVGPEVPFTKICSYEANKITELTNTIEVETDIVSNENKITNSLPKEYSMLQNYPNPFNPVTKIRFDLPNESNVKLAIYDITGREIKVLANSKLNAGTYEYEWNASQFASGIYFYKIQAGDPSARSGQSFTMVRKMVLIK